MSDPRIAELEMALRHIRQLSDKATWLSSTLADGDIFNAIYLLAVDALADEAQPTATTYEAMAI